MRILSIEKEPDNRTFVNWRGLWSVEVEIRWAFGKSTSAIGSSQSLIAALAKAIWNTTLIKIGWEWLDYFLE